MSGFTATCSLCDWREWSASEEVAQVLSVWHVYQEHPEAWRLLLGKRAPADAN